MKKIFFTIQKEKILNKMRVNKFDVYFGKECSDATKPCQIDA
jgi:hypothetical protein